MVEGPGQGSAQRSFGLAVGGGWGGGGWWGWGWRERGGASGGWLGLVEKRGRERGGASGAETDFFSGVFERGGGHVLNANHVLANQVVQLTIGHVQNEPPYKCEHSDLAQLVRSVMTRGVLVRCREHVRQLNLQAMRPVRALGCQLRLLKPSRGRGRRAHTTARPTARRTQQGAPAGARPAASRAKP